MPKGARYNIWDAYVSYGYANTRPRGQDPETHIGRRTREEHAVALVLRQANQSRLWRLGPSTRQSGGFGGICVLQSSCLHSWVFGLYAD
jgi:hypothetical protein